VLIIGIIAVFKNNILIMILFGVLISMAGILLMVCKMYGFGSIQILTSLLAFLYVYFKQKLLIRIPTIKTEMIPMT
jgi:hypothetical protein